MQRVRLARKGNIEQDVGIEQDLYRRLRRGAGAAMRRACRASNKASAPGSLWRSSVEPTISSTSERAERDAIGAAAGERKKVSINPDTVVRRSRAACLARA